MRRTPLVLSLLLTFSSLAPPLAAQLVSHWAGSGNAEDSVGANDGSVVGTVGYRAGYVNTGFDFSGAGSVEVAGALAGGLGSTTGFSIAVYAVLDELVGGEEIVSLLGSGDDSGFSLAVHDTLDDTLVFRVNTSGGTTFASTTDTTFHPGQGHYVVATFDAASHTLRLYHHGLQGTNAAAGGTTMVLDGDETFRIGDGWDGLLDEIRYFDRALTAEEVTSLITTGSIGGGEKLFGDDFESGTTAAWDLVEP